MRTSNRQLPAYGATLVPGQAPGEAPEGVRFEVWAPTHDRVELVLEGRDERVLLTPDGAGGHVVHVPGLEAGALYRLSLDGGPPLPDPASRYQPQGVHGPSQVVDPGAYEWSDEGWGGYDPGRLVVYELHVGTFTPEGTFEGVRSRLGELRDLGVTAIELMPVHDFPGRRNWGYDPAAYWAPSRAYGRPDDLRRLVDEAHALGLGVILDVVYNHLGPDGAYWAAFGPVLTERHHTPWGQAVNLDGPHSRGVRDFIIGNAVHWLREYHVDALRLDATFALVDDSEPHLLTELAAHVEQIPGPPRRLIAEDDRNLAALVQPVSEGGYGLHGVWSDDFHHLVRRIVAGDAHGYFRGFPDSCEALAECLEERWYFRGQRYEHSGAPRGTSAAGVPHDRFVVCIQNHDQIGNRPQGDRLHHGVDPAAWRAASALLAFAPHTPLLFMGQEWMASTPFAYFTDHEPALGKKVSEGRREEFADFPGFAGEVPDPQAEQTFAASVLRWDERARSPHREALALSRELLGRRREVSGAVRAESPGDGLLWVERGRHTLAVCLRGRGAIPVAADASLVLCTEDPAYGGEGGAILEPGLARFEGPGAILVERR